MQVQFSKPLTPEYYPELEYYARCGKCNHVYIVKNGEFYCSRSCEIIDENDVYVLASLPMNVPWVRRGVRS